MLGKDFQITKNNFKCSEVHLCYAEETMLWSLWWAESHRGAWIPVPALSCALAHQKTPRLTNMSESNTQLSQSEAWKDWSHPALAEEGSSFCKQGDFMWWNFNLSQKDTLLKVTFTMVLEVYLLVISLLKLNRTEGWIVAQISQWSHWHW